MKEVKSLNFLVLKKKKKKKQNNFACSQELITNITFLTTA
jgi:hypothetical protein